MSSRARAHAPPGGHVWPSNNPLRQQVYEQLAAQRARHKGILGWIREALGALLSFETAFILYVFSGLYKSDPRLDFIPGDLTAILFGVTVFWGALIMLRQGVSMRPRALNLLWLFFALIVWLWISTLWSPSVWYAQHKALYVPTLTLWAFVAAALVIAPDTGRLRRFFAMFTAFALFVSWESFAALRASFLSHNFGQLIRALGSHYGTLGVVVGNGALMLGLYFLYFARSTWAKLLLGASVVGLMGLLMFMGSRTSLAFPIISGMVPLALNIRLPRTPAGILRLVVVLVIGLVVIVAMWSKVVKLVPGGPATLKRFATLERRGIGTEGRVRNLGDAASILSESSVTELIAGHGIGSWPILVGDEDIQRYPHNLTLEIAVELGLIGLAIFYAMVLYALRGLGTLRQIRVEPLKVFLLTLFISIFIIAHVSGDLHENRSLFMMMGLMTWEPRKPTRRTTGTR